MSYSHAINFNCYEVHNDSAEIYNEDRASKYMIGTMENGT
jgi:hypothetical protein